MKLSALTHIGLTIAPLLSDALAIHGPIRNQLPEGNPVWLAAHLNGTWHAIRTCAANGKALSTRTKAESARSELLMAQNWASTQARQADTAPATAQALRAISEKFALAILVIDSELLATPHRQTTAQQEMPA